MASSTSRKGQSAVEVLVAIVLMGTVTMAAYMLLTAALSEGQYANEQRNAGNLLTEAVEATRQIRDRDFALLTAGTHGLTKSGTTWGFSGAEDVTAALYHRTVAVTQVDADQRDVTVTITWSPKPGRTARVDVTTRLTDWKTPPAPVASNCASEPLTGDWTHPVVLGSGDIGSGNQGTDIAVKWPYLFLSGVASSSSKPDLFVFNATNVASPSLVASLDIGSGGINAISISGNYLYAVSPNDAKEFMVIDITNPVSPVLRATSDLSGTADGLGVLAKGNLVAVGRDLSSASEVVFYNVANPAIPSVVASFQSTDRVNAFVSDSRYVYGISKSADQDIQAYDTFDPLHPSLTSTYDIPDGTEDVSIAFEPPGTLFVGNVSNQFEAIDATDVLNMNEITNFNTGGQVKDVACLTGQLLFLATDNSTKEFTIVNIADINNMAVYASLNFPNFATGVVFVQGKAFLSVRSNDALRIIGPGP